MKGTGFLRCYQGEFSAKTALWADAGSVFIAHVFSEEDGLGVSFATCIWPSFLFKGRQIHRQMFLRGSSNNGWQTFPLMG